MIREYRAGVVYANGVTPVPYCDDIENHPANYQYSQHFQWYELNDSWTGGSGHAGPCATAHCSNAGIPTVADRSAGYRRSASGFTNRAASKGSSRRNSGTSASLNSYAKGFARTDFREQSDNPRSGTPQETARSTPGPAVLFAPTVARSSP